jgi:hypothetical protein
MYCPLAADILMVKAAYNEVNIFFHIPSYTRAVILNVHLKMEEMQIKKSPMETVLSLVYQQIKKHTEVPWDADSLHWKSTAGEVTSPGPRD